MLPKNVWIWWEQGWDKAPYITQYTVKSFQMLNPDYRIHQVSKDNINLYLKDVDWIFECEGAAFRADIVRLLLLQKHGGVYTDAATFCCVNIDAFVKEINFNDFWGFDLKSFNPKSDSRTLCSWFYISMPDTYIINTFTNKFITSAKKNPIKHVYYEHHRILSSLIKTNPYFTNWYNNLTKISGFQNRISMDSIITQKNNKPKWFHPNNIMQKIENDEFKIIKLRHKACPPKNKLLEKNTIFSKLLERYVHH